MTSADLPIDGICDSRFQRVRDAFLANFSDDGEWGAAACVIDREIRQKGIA
ncbi:MAG: hypothetical protein HUJ31_01365, partial [Pseudomonadales bacterium]|nr:hypothetical protein [Pseudomonadales bacterium]